VGIVYKGSDIIPLTTAPPQVPVVLQALTNQVKTNQNQRQKKTSGEKTKGEKSSGEKKSEKKTDSDSK